MYSFWIFIPCYLFVIGFNFATAFLNTFITALEAAFFRHEM